jgi:hypothetical protein
MAHAVGLDDPLLALNDDLYLMSSYGRRYGLDKEKENDKKPADEEVSTFSNGLVLYDNGSDPRDGRRSRTAIILDSIAEICLSQPGEVYAVACVVPLKKHSTAASASLADKPPTLIVAENRGVPPETQRYLHDVLQGLRRISLLARPTFPPKVDPYSRSPSVPKQPSIQSESDIPFSLCLLCSTRFRLSLCGQNYD